MRERPWRCAVFAAAALCLAHIAIAAEGTEDSVQDCKYGTQPGTMLPTGERGFHWMPFAEQCRPEPLLRNYTGLDLHFASKNHPPATFLLLGDSVDRFLVDDVYHFCQDDSHLQPNMLYIERRYAALRVPPRLEMVYHFMPGSHATGPYHDEIPMNESVVNSIPEAMRQFREVTGQERPNVVVFSALIWDVGRWHVQKRRGNLDFGEFLPASLLHEWQAETSALLEWVEELVGGEALLIYHNAAYPKMIDCANGTDHLQNGAGKRTHFVQLNAAARVMVAKRRRWRLVDFGARSEAFLYGEHLRDWHHPDPAFMLDIMDTYLNMHRQHQARLVAERETAAAAAAEEAAKAAEVPAEPEVKSEDGGFVSRIRAHLTLRTDGG